MDYQKMHSTADDALDTLRSEGKTEDEETEALLAIGGIFLHAILDIAESLDAAVEYMRDE